MALLCRPLLTVSWLLLVLPLWSYKLGNPRRELLHCTTFVTLFFSKLAHSDQMISGSACLDLDFDSRS